MLSLAYDFCYSGIRQFLHTFSGFDLRPEREENLQVSLEKGRISVNWSDESDRNKWVRLEIAFPENIDYTRNDGMYSLADYQLSKAAGLYLHWKQEAHLKHFSVSQPGCKAECLSCKKTSFGICRDIEVKVTNGEDITIHASDSLYGFVS